MQAGDEPAAQNPAALPAIEARKIWDEAPHNAFTDLIRFRDVWFCAFREGSSHTSPDGAIRILRSVDGVVWSSVARLTLSTGDLRDPKLSITPDQRLMLVAGVTFHQPAPAKNQSHAWFSPDGAAWSTARPIGEPNFWLWRVTWQGTKAYGVGYRTVGTPAEWFTRLYESDDGINFRPIVDRLFTQLYPNEATLRFLPDGTALCLLRREFQSTQIGSARPPYREWTWRSLPMIVGGPDLLILPSGAVLSGARLYGCQPGDAWQKCQTTWTGVSLIDWEDGSARELFRVPSTPETGYPGLAYHDGRLWISYYSYPGKNGGLWTSIHLAKISPFGLFKTEPKLIHFYTDSSSSSASQLLQLKNVGTGTLAWSASVTTNPQGWLRVTPQAATAPTAVTVTADSSALGPGLHVGKIRFETIGGAAPNSPHEVQVVLMAGEPRLGGVMNGASFALRPVAPGSIVSLFGDILAAAPAAAPGPTLPQVMQDTFVLVGGVRAPLFYVSQTQINFQIPWEVSGAEITVRVGRHSTNRISAGLRVPLASYAPGIFTSPSGGTGQAAALNQDSTPNSTFQPASRGSVVSIFLTGLGPVNPPVATGQRGSGGSQLSWVTTIPEVTIGTYRADVLYAGLAPGYVGLYQLNVRVPWALEPGVAPVVVRANNSASNIATLAVR